jgi:PAS domain S-box-containing protein
MGEMDKTKEQLTQELAQAQKRIAELEATTAASGKISSLYYGIFENFVESATDSFSIWDSNLNLIYINNATLKYHPAVTKKSDVIGKNIKEMIPDCEKSGRYEKYKKALETGEPLILEDFKADPKYGDTYLSIKVFKINDGIGIISSDITERKHMEQAILDSQQRLSALIDNAPDVILTYDLNGRFTSGNKKAEELMGYSKGEMLGKTFAESGIFTPESLARVEQRLENYKLGKSAESTPYELISRDGSHIFVEVRGIPVVQGDTMEIIAIARDITKRRMAEDALRNSEEKLRAIFESIGDSITVIDVNGNITDLNDAALNLFGHSKKEEVLGMNSLTFIAEEDRPSVADKLNQAKPERFVQYKFKRKDGSIFRGEASSDALYDKSGNITGFIGIVRDITERKRIEKELNDYKKNLEKMVKERTTELASTYEELRESEEKLRAFFENVPDILFAHNMQGQFTDINRKALEISGYSHDEIVGKNILETGFLPADQIEGVVAGIKGIEEGKSGYPYEVQLMKKDGSRITVEAVSFPIRRKGVFEVMGIARDITERKRMENALKNSEEKLRTMFTSMADGVVVTDLEGNFKDANAALLHMFGYSSKKDVMGMNGFDLIAEKDRNLAMGDMTQLFIDGLVTGRSWTFKHSSGGEFQAPLC